MAEYFDQNGNLVNDETDATASGDQSGTDAQSQGQEKMVDFEGKQVPYSELKQWYDSHTNRTKWQGENTKKAMEIAKQRKEWESQYPQYEGKIKQWDTFNQFVAQHPDLRDEIEAAFRKRAGVSGVGGVARDPRVDELNQKLSKYDEFMTTYQQDVESRKFQQDREQAYALLAKNDPNFKKDDFETFVNDVSTKAENIPELYQILYKAFMAKSASDIAKDAEKKTLENIKKKQGAAVQTGKGGNTARDTPNNEDISQFKDTGALMEYLYGQLGDEKK
jgi:hypothetical protein